MRYVQPLTWIEAHEERSFPVLGWSQHAPVFPTIGCGALMKHRRADANAGKLEPEHPPLSPSHRPIPGAAVQFALRRPAGGSPDAMFGIDDMCVAGEQRGRNLMMIAARSFTLAELCVKRVARRVRRSPIR